MEFARRTGAKILKDRQVRNKNLPNAYHADSSRRNFVTDLPIFLTTRTLFSDQCYEVIGRALAYATSFECNCKSLGVIIKMKQEFDLNNDESVSKLCHQARLPLGFWTKALGKVFREAAKPAIERNDVTAGQLTFEPLIAKIKDAREARNEIAHDLTKGIEHRAEDEKEKGHVMKEVEILVRKIAEADVHVYNLCQTITKEPPYQDANDYCERAVKWVCEIEDS